MGGYGYEYGGGRSDRGCAGEWWAGAGTWRREAWRVGVLAAELGAVLDGETLILSDVRELAALRVSLQQALRGDGRRSWREGRTCLPRGIPAGIPVGMAVTPRAGHGPALTLTHAVAAIVARLKRTIPRHA